MPSLSPLHPHHPHHHQGMSPGAYNVEELNNISNRILIWQEFTLAVAKILMGYCVLSLLVLCMLMWLIASGTISADKKDMAIMVETNATIGKAVIPSLPPHLRHHIQFYTFILTLLVSLRAALYYMANTLKKAAIEQNVGVIQRWIILTLIIIIGELFFGISLMECLSGPLFIVVIFIFSEVFMEASLLWIVCKFKMQLQAI